MKNTLKTGPVQKQGAGTPQVGGGVPGAYHGNARLPLDPRLARATFKSQGTKQKD